MRLLRNLAVGAASLLAAFTMAAPAANAGVTLLQPGCNLYTTGCLFSWAGPPGNIFEDPVAIMAAYNLVHNASPPPEDLTGLTFLGKAEEGGSISYVVNGNGSWTFTDLPWDVMFYTVKQAGDYFILFGLDPATDSFTAANTQITQPGISHVSFFSAGGAVPEPATWAMMILGFGMVGVGMRLSRRSRTPAVA